MLKLDREKLNRNIETMLRKNIDDGLIFGAVCEVRQAGETVARQSMGRYRFDTDEKPKGDSLFRFASMSKNIAGLSALQMIEKGKLNLDDRVSRYFPGFDKKAENPVLIRHLLTHTSGIVNPEGGWPEEVRTIQDAARFYERELPLAFEPGTEWRYSASAAFDVLGSIIEMICGMSYGEYIEKYITGPLGMKDTGFHPNSEQWSRMASVYLRDEDGNAYEPDDTKHCMMAGMPLSYESGGANLAGTLDDYIKFADMLRNFGKGENGERIITERSARLLTIPLTPYGMKGMFTSNTAFSFAARVFHDHPWMPEGAFGWNGLYGCQTFIDQTNGISAVIMKNGLVEAFTRLKGGDMSDEVCPDRFFEQAVYHSAVSS